MKKTLIFAAIIALCAFNAHTAVRTGNAPSRTTAQTTPQRVTTSARTAKSRGATLTPRGGVTSTTASRAATARATSTAITRGTDTDKSRSATARNASQSVTPRAAAIDETSQTIAQTRIGAAYEQCKSAFFTCMDQFCTLKNDDYRRCACSNRVYALAEARQTLQDAGQQLTVFTENLDVVGMNAAQAQAMKTASEGENALTADTSASKALLQAIMNSIRGEDSSVGGKYSDLNSISISFDTANAFGMTDAGQAIAKNNGQNLYTAVYPQCRAAVKADCNDASLQRAITAYLMAIEQDCNKLETAIAEKQKQMKSAIREGSAMLDLARVENRQKHNSSDIATCVAEVETAILSEEVCGAGYRRCLDNGEYIDITTGAPITGVSDFYKLGQLLKFADDKGASDQRLTKIPSNRQFVQNFEKRTKKFAQPALDKCTEQADTVWAEYLDKAMLDIYYAQQSKVSEIKQGCFDFVSACYMNGDTAITAAMKELTGDSSIIINPSKVVLNDQLCTDYVDSCNNMFDKNIIQAYIDNRTDTDSLAACRAVVQQCFNKYGGTNYENFYYPYSGLFKQGEAPDWFTLYEYEYLPTAADKHDATKFPLTVKVAEDITRNAAYKSECAIQLTKIDACNTQEMIENAFGGFDKMAVVEIIDNNTESAIFWRMAETDEESKNKVYSRYGRIQPTQSGTNQLRHRYLRPTGVATEVYNNIVDVLSTQCQNLDGRFVEYQFIKNNIYGNTLNDKTNIKYQDNGHPTQSVCISNFGALDEYAALRVAYSVANGENMCPRDYDLNVDTTSWGACLCWENGARRSKWGKSAKCLPAFPVTKSDAVLGDTTISEDANDVSCETQKDASTIYRRIRLDEVDATGTPILNKHFSEDKWCLAPNVTASNNQVCWGKNKQISDGSNDDTPQPLCDTPQSYLPVGLPY